MNKNKIEWIFLGVITFLLIIFIIIPNSAADEFMHEININSTGDTEINIVINVTEKEITNKYYDYSVDKKKTTNYLADSFDVGNKFMSYSDIQVNFRNKVWNYILAKLYPYFTHVNAELASCKEYNILNEQRIFELQKRVNELEAKK